MATLANTNSAKARLLALLTESATIPRVLVTAMITIQGMHVKYPTSLALRIARMPLPASVTHRRVNACASTRSMGQTAVT